MTASVPDEVNPLKDARHLLGGMLEHLESVVGPEAAYAMFHYAAALEGERLAGDDSESLEALLGRVDALLGTQTRILEDDGSSVRVEIRPDSIRFDKESTRGFIAGLVNGLLSETRRRGFAGEPEGHADPETGTLTLIYRSGDA